MNLFQPFQDTLSQLLSPIAFLCTCIYDMMRKTSLKVRLSISLLTITFALAVSCGATSAIADKYARELGTQDSCVSNYSTWMAESLISRQQGIMTNAANVAQPLQAGITQKALTAVLDQYPDNQLIRNYILHSTNVAASYMTDLFKDVNIWPLDRLSNGNAMVQNGILPYKEALIALSDSIQYNQRNSEHGLWYWHNYPQWSYLDGMFSYAPFMAIYNFGTGCGDVGSRHPMDHGACIFKNDTMTEIYLQFTLLWHHCRNTTTGLLYHGYDASKKATWAARATGASPIVWGRSLGWYAMALVDTMELLPTETAAPWQEPLLSYYQDLSQSIMQAVDKTTGGWYQVVDQGTRQGNYIESSATAMFSYALLKGVRLGYIAEDYAKDARDMGLRAHRYLTEVFVVREKGGTLGWNGTVSVCSLNSSATYEYYTGQPIDYNSPLGAGAYILASVEAERLGTA